MIISRSWAMPSADTFSIPPIRAFVERWLYGRSQVLDPFARNSRYGTLTNDLSTDTIAEYHMEAREFLQFASEAECRFDAVLFDPPYSPRQISEVYKQVGREIGSTGTQNSKLYKECRDLFRPLVRPGGVVLSFGWNTSTMGKEFELKEILLVAHGGAHNDTLCRAEMRLGACNTRL